MQKSRLLSSIFFLIVLAFDQGTKLWAVDTLSPFAAIEITPFFNLVFVLNHGVTFGLFQQNDLTGIWMLIGLSLTIVLYLLWLWWSSDDHLEHTLLMAVIAGALGNVIDRIRIGAVIDFLDFHVASYHWPAFNIADSVIVVGIALYIWRQITHDHEQN